MKSALADTLAQARRQAGSKKTALSNKARADMRRRTYVSKYASKESVKNLWGVLPQMDDVVTPLMMLRQQAGFLQKATNGILDASVTTVPMPNGRLRHSFYLVAPLLGNYRHMIFTVEHGVDPYPAEVKPTLATKPLPCPSQQAFENLLPKILQHPDTRKAISSLMANSSAVKMAA